MKNAKRTGGFSPPNTTSDSFRVGNSLFRMRPPTVALLNLLGAVPFQTHSVTRKLEEWQRLLSGSSLLDFFDSRFELANFQSYAVATMIWFDKLRGITGMKISSGWFQGKIYMDLPARSFAQ